MFPPGYNQPPQPEEKSEEKCVFFVARDAFQAGDLAQADDLYSQAIAELKATASEDSVEWSSTSSAVTEVETTTAVEQAPDAGTATTTKLIKQLLSRSLCRLKLRCPEQADADLDECLELVLRKNGNTAASDDESQHPEFNVLEEWKSICNEISAKLLLKDDFDAKLPSPGADSTRTTSSAPSADTTSTIDDIIKSDILGKTTVLSTSAVQQSEEQKEFLQKIFFRKGQCKRTLQDFPAAVASFLVSGFWFGLSMDLIAKELQLTSQHYKFPNSKFFALDFMKYYTEPWDWSTVKGLKDCKGCGQLTNFVHENVKIELIPGKGRGLVVRKNTSCGKEQDGENFFLPAGTLLTVEKAFVIGKNELLVEKTEEKLKILKSRSSEVSSTDTTAACPSSQQLADFWQLSDGTKESETVLPTLAVSVGAAAAEAGVLVKTDTVDITKSSEKVDHTELIENILTTNTHTLQTVDTYNVPMKVSTDVERSALWLHGAYTNHGCLPTVHRVICDDWLIVRAIRDLYDGDELLDSYCEVLRPLSVRNKLLTNWGFNAENKSFRAEFEKAVFGTTEAVEDKLRHAAKILEIADLEDCCNDLERFCLQKLDAFLHSGFLSAEWFLDLLPTDLKRRFAEILDGSPPASATGNKPSEDGTANIKRNIKYEKIPLQRFVELRFLISEQTKHSKSTCFNDRVEELKFFFQEILLYFALSIFANVYRKYAMAIKEKSNGFTGFSEIADAYDRFAKILAKVLPYSELLCEMLSERLNQRSQQYGLTLTEQKLMSASKNVGGSSTSGQAKKKKSIPGPASSSGKFAKIEVEVVELLDCFHKCYCFDTGKNVFSDLEQAELVFQIWERVNVKLFSEEVKQQVRVIWINYCISNAEQSTSAGAARTASASHENVETSTETLLLFEPSKELIESVKAEQAAAAGETGGPVKPTRSAFSFDKKIVAASEKKGVTDGDKGNKKAAKSSAGDNKMKSTPTTAGPGAASTATVTAGGSTSKQKPAAKDEQETSTSASTVSKSTAKAGGGTGGAEIMFMEGSGSSSSSSMDEAEKSRREKQLPVQKDGSSGGSGSSVTSTTVMVSDESGGALSSASNPIAAPLPASKTKSPTRSTRTSRISKITYQGTDYGITKPDSDGTKYTVAIGPLDVAACPEVGAQPTGEVQIGEEIVGPLPDFSMDTFVVKFSKKKKTLTLTWEK
ncbi:unnamed protein product [Amoebophrya sp. A120]|nr:unnamed protein product [Amoebophrya sp. A120]|eukprot:GSA120T00025917001.1